MLDTQMEKLLSKFLGEEIIEIKLSNNGYLSQGYKITGKNKNYFMRNIKKGNPGFEYILDDAKSFEISNIMTQNSGIMQSYGVMHDDQGNHYHITDFWEGKVLGMNEIDEDIIIKIAEKIASIHNHGKSIANNIDEKQRSYLYKRSIREIITNNETLFSVFENHITLVQERKFFEEMIKKMLNIYFASIENADIQRITCLHGDFWNGNILINEQKEINFIDFSRIPYGEPGIDIGRFVANFDIENLITGNNKFLILKRIFLDKYIQLTGDEHIEKNIKLSSMWVGFIALSPLAQQFLKWSEEQKNAVKKWVMEI